MSASAINMWIDAFRDSVSAHIDLIHPSAQCICGEYFNEMHRAAAAADMDELGRLIALTQNKIADELEWEEDKARAAADRNYVPRCIRG